MSFLFFFLINNGWSQAIFLSHGYTSYPNQQNIVCDAEGGAHTIWFKWHVGPRYSMWYDYYTGTDWTSPKEISDISTRTMLSYPSIAVWEEDVYCIWQHEREYSNIELRRFWQGNWEDTMIIISSGARYSYSPTLICDSQEKVHIVWEREYEIYYRTLSGNTLSKETVLSNSKVYAAYPSIASFGNKVFVVWEDLRDGNFEIYFKEFDGNKWTEDKRVTNSTFASLFPNLAVDQNGVVHIVWQEEGIGGYKIFYTKYSRGSFTSPTLLVNSQGEAITPSITSHGTTLHLVWSDSRDGDWEIYYKNYDGTWGEEVRVTHSHGISADPSICATSEGKLYLLFWDTRDSIAAVYFKEKEGTKNKNISEPQNLTISPNPFVDKTVISFQLPSGKKEKISLRIYDLAGRLICSLPIHRVVNSIVQTTWNGRNSQGKRVREGIYFVKLGNSKKVQKIVLIK